MAVRVGGQLFVAPEGMTDDEPRCQLTVRSVRDGLVWVTGDIERVANSLRATILVPEPTTVVNYKASVVLIEPDAVALQIDERIGAMQRRHWFRVPAHLPLDATVSTPDDPDGRWRVLRGETLDISAGGLRFRTRDDTAVPPGLPMAIDLCLPDGPMHATAAPVTTRLHPDQTAVRFVTLSPADRERLVGAVLEQQRHQLAVKAS